MSTRKKAAVKFGDPPPERKPAPYDWPKIADKLRAKPGEWALIFKQDKASYATAIRIKGIKALHPDKGFEVRTENNVRTPSPRICDLWMRYNPEKDRSN